MILTSNTGSVDIQPSSSKVTRLTKTIPNLQPGVTYTVLVRANKNGQYSDYASKTFTTPNADKSGNNFTVSNTNTDIQLLGGGFAASSTAHPFPINIGKIDITQNTIAGSGTGVIMNQYGIAGFKEGIKQFSLSASTGDAYFAGTLHAATGTFSGSLSAATGSFSGAVTATSGYIANFTINTDNLISSRSVTDPLTNITTTYTIGIYNSSQALLGYSGGIKIYNSGTNRKTSYLVEYGLIVTPTAHDGNALYAGRYSNDGWYIHDPTDGYASGRGAEITSSIYRSSIYNYEYRLAFNNASGIKITKTNGLINPPTDDTYSTSVINNFSKLDEFALRNIYIQSGTFSAQSGADKGDIILVY